MSNEELAAMALGHGYAEKVRLEQKFSLYDYTKSECHSSLPRPSSAYADTLKNEPKVKPDEYLHIILPPCSQAVGCPSGWFKVNFGKTRGSSSCIKHLSVRKFFLSMFIYITIICQWKRMVSSLHFAYLKILRFLKRACIYYLTHEPIRCLHRPLSSYLWWMKHTYNFLFCWE